MPIDRANLQTLVNALIGGSQPALVAPAQQQAPAQQMQQAPAQQQQAKAKKKPTKKPAEGPKAWGAQWWKKLPQSGPWAAAEMSRNAGMNRMPGGMVGAVRLPAIGGDGQAPKLGLGDPTKYGMSPKYGEATFFQQAVNGGVTPLTALSPMVGVPGNWKPNGGGGGGGGGDGGGGQGGNGGSGGTGGGGGTGPGGGDYVHPGPDNNAKMAMVLQTLAKGLL